MNTIKRIVVKIGTKVIASKDRGLDRERVRDLVGQIAGIMGDGTQVLVVTSGAIGAGMWLLNMKKRPSRLEELQATASIGQNYLMQVYGELFKERGYLVGQILLTQEDFNDRARYLNIKHTIEALFRHGAVPVINENDTVATEEIKCGDNDRLSGLVADLCRAGRLILLTDVDGLLDADGTVIENVGEITPEIIRLCGGTACDLGTGGMATKIESAKMAVSSGIECVIANGRKKGVIAKIMRAGGAGTTFAPSRTRLLAKKRWIAFSSRTKGSLMIDDGAREALAAKHKSLLASGIVSSEGAFSSGEVVRIIDSSGRELARGVSNYSSRDIAKIKGLRSQAFKDALGYRGPDEVVHKDNLVIL